MAQGEDRLLNFVIDAKSAVPVYEQIKQEIKLLIMSGYLQPGDKILPIRELAAQLKVNANTIVKVYYQLDVEGFIYSQPGTGYFVRDDRKDHQKERIALFKNITEEYLSKATHLGFSIKQMVAELERRIGGENPKQDGEG